MTQLKIMIVDDDQLVRTRLAEMLPLEELSLELCCEADNGIDALNLYHQHHPQIVILDIDIPLINGLELAKMICREDRDVRIIIVTGFGSLDFAREAIHAHAVDFLMKPVRQDEITSAIQRAIASFQEKAAQLRYMQQAEVLLRESLPLLRERYLINLLTNGTVETEEGCRAHLLRIGVAITQPYFCTAVVLPDYSEVEPSEWEVVQIAIQNIATEICSDLHLDSSIFFDSMQRSIILVQGPDNQLAKPLEEALLLLREKMALHYHYMLSAGIGSSVSQLHLLSQSFHDALEALNYKGTFGQNGVCSIENVFSIEQTEESPLRAEMDYIFERLQTGDQEETLTSLKHFFSSTVRIAGGAEDHIRWSLIELVARLSTYVYSRKINMNGEKLSATDLYSQIFLTPNPFLMQKRIYDLFAAILLRQKEQRVSRSEQLIERACLYILQNCSDPELNLSEVSACVDLTNVYFSTLFRKKKDMTFTDYLNKVRVDKAKQYLRDPQCALKMYEIAEAVGYANPKYFYQIFKKLTGQSPKQFSESVS